VKLKDHGVNKKIGSSFYRGEVCNANPYRDDFRSETFLEDYLLKGWLPAEPFLDKGTRITAFGSCFARNLTKHLTAIGYNLSSGRDPSIHISTMGEGLVNTYALLGQFEWALEAKKQPVDLWHGFKGEDFGYDEEIRERTRDVFLTTDFFVITLGLSEVWYDEPTGGVFWRAVPVDRFDASRHKFRVSTVEETKTNLRRMYELIRRHAPDAKVLFTLSPISLAATFRPVSCITANVASKAILRAGLDEFMRENAADLNRRLFYFPSYEILLNLFTDPWRHDNRHPQNYVIDSIMKIFEAAYCRNETTLAEANRVLQVFRADNLRDVTELALSTGVQPPRHEPADANAEDDARAQRKARRRAARAARATNGNAEAAGE
jgi:hypothetical protein